MKKRIFKLIAAAFIIAVAIGALASCSQWQAPYQELDKDGNNVSVKFVANGGMFANTNGVTVVDVFKASDAIDGKISILAPDDERRQNNAFSITKSGHFLAGWYECEPIVNQDGKPLDEDGNVAEESGKDIAYKPTRKWNFETDRLTVDSSSEYSSSEPALTLCAVWIPFFNFEFYAKNDSGEFTLIGTANELSVELPEWNSSSGQLNMKKYPAISGKTFDSAYLDPEFTSEITDSVTGQVDYEKGQAVTSTIKIYTTWVDGEWFKIYNASQFYKNAKANGNYILAADIDFSKSVWPTVFTSGKFTGKIYGEGHTLSGINITQSGYKISEGGIFGTIDSGAEIKDLKLDNISYTVKGSLYPAVFGLVAGRISEDAIVENVSVLNGKLIIDDELFTDNTFKTMLQNDDYEFYLTAGSGGAVIEDYNITCTQKEGSRVTDVQISVSEDGSISFVFQNRN